MTWQHDLKVHLRKDAEHTYCGRLIFVTEFAVREWKPASMITKDRVTDRLDLTTCLVCDKLWDEADRETAVGASA